MTGSHGGSLTDEILGELGSGLAHQRHKWAAQCHAYGLSMMHFQVLAILDAEGPTQMSHLADQLGVALPNVTGIIGRMEERGLVERVHDADDRRVVLAQLTEAGGEVVRTVESTRFEHMRRLVEALTPDEQQTVLTALKTLTSAHARLHATGAEHPHPDHEAHGDRVRAAHTRSNQEQIQV
jgi:DNA-binding MarR family transcriptional regulator